MLTGHIEIVLNVFTACDKYALSFVLNKKQLCFGLAKAWVRTGKRVNFFSKILYDRMKIKVKADGA